MTPIRLQTCSTIVSGCVLLLALASAAEAANPTARYQCKDGSTFKAIFTPPGSAKGTASLAFADGSILILPQGLSADGGRYVGHGTEFWIKGNGATYSVGNKSTTCKVVK